METCPKFRGRRFTAPLAVAIGSCIAACGPSVEPVPEGEIHYTRNRVELYSGLEPDAPATATLPFDTRVTILDRHRSFVRIQTPTRLQGWVPRSLLLDHLLRRQLRTLSDASEALPSQGLSRARDTLNVHVQPYRWSPTFYQLEKDEGFHILDRVLVDRLPASAATARTPPLPTGEDYWYLVRVPGIGQSGWLLGNMAYADIPLEVAMLASGQSIVAYLPLGFIEDKSPGETKTTWLWVQSTASGQAHDFDRLSVLQWDSKRDRYVIIRQDSNLTGYLPIELIPDFETKRGTGTGLRILFESNGEMRQRTHVYTKQRVYLIDEQEVTGAPRYVPPGGFGSRYEFNPPSRAPS